MVFGFLRNKISLIQPVIANADTAEQKVDVLFTCAAIVFVRAIHDPDGAEVNRTALRVRDLFTEVAIKLASQLGSFEDSPEHVNDILSDKLELLERKHKAGIDPAHFLAFSDAWGDAVFETASRYGLRPNELTQSGFDLMAFFKNVPAPSDADIAKTHNNTKKREIGSFTRSYDMWAKSGYLNPRSAKQNS